MWTVESRARHDRGKLCYPSDLTDGEWSLAETEIPRAKRGGNKRTVDVRGVMNGLMYVLSTGCHRRAIPKDLPPCSTVNFHFCRWQHDGTLDRLHHALYVLCREQADREVNVEVVRRCDTGKFMVLPKRWIVERTIAWLNRGRRLSKDWECLNRNALAFLR